MNNQQFFDITAKHLFEQGVQAVDNHDNCKYRGPNGTKCAVGVHIPDELYDPMMDDGNTCLSTVTQKVPQLQAVRPRLIASMQSAHDTARNWTTSETMRAALRRLAKDYDLDGSIVDSLSFGDR